MSVMQVLYAEIAEEMGSLTGLLPEAEDLSRNKKPVNLHLRAAGSILHDFYTGVEKIFERIARAVDNSVPSGERWHIELLHQMSLEIVGLRSPVISKKTEESLIPYLRFRHLFRKKYGFNLEWPQIKILLNKMPETFDLLKKDITLTLEKKTSFPSGFSPGR